MAFSLLKYDTLSSYGKRKYKCLVTERTGKGAGVHFSWDFKESGPKSEAGNSVGLTELGCI